MNLLINLHPPLVAFPLSLITIVFFFELFNLKKRSTAIDSFCRIGIVLAGIFVALAFFSGYQASELANGMFEVPDEVIEKHHLFGRALLFLIFPCVALKFIGAKATHSMTMFRIFYFIFLFINFSLVIYTGYLGGRLIFRYGAYVTVDNH